MAATDRDPSSSSAPSAPRTLRVVRHGESEGNVARDRAESGGFEVIEIDQRDMDVDLSARGVEQARSLGSWLRDLDERPRVVLTSPYRRARRTAEIAVAEAGLDVPVVLDERLREREFGVLDRLTKRGIEARYPEEAAARARLGKFYHRPPGGESWCDVGLRVRSLLDTLGRDHAGEDVLLVAHEVVIHLFRYVLEHLEEPDLLQLAHDEPLANCAVATYRLGPDGLRLVAPDDEAPVEAGGAPRTAEPDPGVQEAP